VNIKPLLGSGDRIMLATLPFAVLGIVLNIIHPELFHTHLGSAGIILGWVFLAVGIPMWFASVALIVIHVPRGELITTGPFAVVAHPLYTSVALLVIPGTGFLLDTWVGLIIGLVLYMFSRIYAVLEEKKLEEAFPTTYQSYRDKIVFPWL